MLHVSGHFPTTAMYHEKETDAFLYTGRTFCWLNTFLLQGFLSKLVSKNIFQQAWSRIFLHKTISPTYWIIHLISTAKLFSYCFKINKYNRSTAFRVITISSSFIMYLSVTTTMYHEKETDAFLYTGRTFCWLNIFLLVNLDRKINKVF